MLSVLPGCPCTIAAAAAQSFLIEISAIIAAKKDAEGEGFLVDKIVDKTGAKGTGGFGSADPLIR